MKKLWMAVVVCLLTTGFVYAAEKGTAKVAVALVDKAANFYQANGKDKAFAEINKSEGQFVKGDLYVFVWSLDYVVLAHPKNAALIGKNLKAMKDTDGKAFVFEAVELAKSKGNGWMDYKYTNPTTKKIEPKSTYVKKVGDSVFACGIYK